MAELSQIVTITSGNVEASWNHGGNSTDGALSPLDFLEGRDYYIEFVDVDNIKVHISFLDMENDHQFKVIISYETGVKLVTDSLSLSDTILRNKPLIPIADTLTLTDSLYKTRQFAIGDSLSLVDAIIRNKDLIIPDVVNLSDSMLAHKAFVFAENVSLSDAIIRDKDLIIPDAVTLSDFMLAHKTFIFAESIGLSDISLLHKIVQIAETISIAESIIRNKMLTIPETISLSDTIIQKWVIALLLGELVIREKGGKLEVIHQ